MKRTIFHKASMLLLLVVSVLLCSPSTAGQGLIDSRPANEFVELDIHALLGGSAVSQNYMKSFPEIQELNASMGTAYGIGAGVVFGLRRWLGFGTELNLLVGRNRMDVAVASADGSAMSNVFLRNRYTYANIPVYMSFRCEVMHGLRWNIDAGLYYAYGLGGSQKQTLYNMNVNDLGQLLPSELVTKPPYFHSTATFVNSFQRGDIGLHLATALLFGRHLTLGGRINVGLKNITEPIGIVRPSMRTFYIMAQAGWKF